MSLSVSYFELGYTNDYRCRKGNANYSDNTPEITFERFTQ